MSNYIHRHADVHRALTSSGISSNANAATLARLCVLLKGLPLDGERLQGAYLQAVDEGLKTVFEANKSDLYRRFRNERGMWQGKFRFSITTYKFNGWIDLGLATPDEMIASRATFDDAETFDLFRSEMLSRLSKQSNSVRKSVTAKTPPRQTNDGGSGNHQAMTSTAHADLVAEINERLEAITVRNAIVETIAADPYPVYHIAGLEGGARQRRIIAMVGPTNSGKTHAALQMLIAAETGAYLAPLRLMALEGYDRLTAAGLRTEMVTGEEILTTDDPTHLSATIEMANVNHHVACVVVDEGQLLDDEDRGWAWTRAIFHTQADIVIITGSPDLLPILDGILKVTGETVEIQRFERRAPLRHIEQKINLQDLKAGDAVIAFSRAAVLNMKKRIGQLKDPVTREPYQVAAIYGSLGPEVRRGEARRFASGAAQILVATDAIGLGLNLPINRILFSATEKFDGRELRNLHGSEIRQIGGRAGRHQQAEGWVGLLNEARGSVKAMHSALNAQSRTPPDVRPYIWPTLDQIERGMVALGIPSLSKALPAVARILQGNQQYRCSISDDTLDLVQVLEQAGLSPQQAYGWIGCPIRMRDPFMVSRVTVWARAQKQAKPAAFGHAMPSFRNGEAIRDEQLKEIETAVAIASSYLWLSRGLPEIFCHADTAALVRDQGNAQIEIALSQKILARSCRCGNALPPGKKFEICEECFKKPKPKRQRY